MFLLDYTSKTEIYRQIKNQMIRFIETGVLRSGERIPSVRSLASELGINPNTVQKAYMELEKEGWVYNIPKKGVYVQGRPKGAKPSDPVKEALQKWKDQGLSKEALLERIEEVYEEE